MDFKISGRKIKVKEEYIEESSKEIKKQIQDYLKSERTVFDLSVKFPENFTGEVMEELSQIPYGETHSYTEVAEKLETAPIAVGQACGRNPIPLVIPCHRVVGKNSIGGYRYGEKVKEKLLDLEKSKQGN